MDMEHGRYLHLALLMTTVFSLSPGTKANYIHLWAENTTVWHSVIQNNTGRYQNKNINTNPVTPEVDYKLNSTGTPEAATSSRMVSVTPTSELEPSTSLVRDSSPTAESVENSSKSHSEIFKKDVCEENTTTMAILICLVVIAVLFLMCTLLFLSTVVLANKVSSLRRAKPAGKRQLRSNGDFLASSGLWPADSDTWKRAKPVTGPSLALHCSGVLTATGERNLEDGTEKLTSEQTP
ncbi:protein EVI2A [Ctenodactylus gundi]